MVVTYFIIKDETFQRRGRLQKRSVLFLNGWLKHAPVGSCALTDALSTHRESFALVKGAVHLLEDAEKAHLDEDVSSMEESEKAPDAQSRQLHAMVEQLRPEDTMKLVSVSLYLQQTLQREAGDQLRVFPEEQVGLLHSILVWSAASLAEQRHCLFRAYC